MPNQKVFFRVSLGEFEGACDHRRAEITHGQLWDRVPASAWKNVE
ncbi:Hha/YmoA family nucleoid-associated regulatory protein [Pseudomonas aeruginosa]